jgi:hypothetical protein
MDKINDRKETTDWRGLYRAGGIAPLVVLAFYLSELLLPAFGGPYPETTQGWFELFERSKLLGLFYLNSLDILSIALLGIMFLALGAALWRTSESAVAAGGFFAFLGIAVFIVPRTILLAILPLSERYAAATSQAGRTLLLTAGETIGMLGQPSFQTAGFFFIAAAVLVLSLVMLRGGPFSKATAWLGILAGALVILDDISLVLAPSLAVPLMGLGGLLWIAWWLLIGLRLLKLGRTIPTS